MDYTQIIIYVIGIIVTIMLGLVSKHLIPWLKEKNLYESAVIAVNAAEALYGRYKGEEKLAAALESLKEKGYNIDSVAVKDAVRAAWKQLDRAMYDSGEKLPQE
jgi:hypothetical protein